MPTNKPMKISEEAAVQMPMKTVASLIAIIAIGTWAYFGIHEKLNQHSTQIELMQKDLEQNSEFRIKYPRGELGQSAGEAELFMIVEHFVRILCNPAFILDVPFCSLDLIVWYVVSCGKITNIPKNTIIRLN